MNKNKLTQRNLIQYLDIQFKAITAWSKEVSHHPSGKPVHELRLATRHARAALWVLKHSSEHLRFKKLDRELQQLGRTLGMVREIDVAISDANHYRIKSAQMIPQRMHAVKKLKKLVKAEARKDLKKLLVHAARALRLIGPLRMKEAKVKLTRTLHTQLNQHMDGPATFHKLRITVKKARYAIEAMGVPIHPMDRSNHPIVAPNHPMKKLQDFLGKAHDLELLQGFTGKKARIKRKQKVLNAKALLLSTPALNFAVSQLKEN
jgi:CHAD domain-containing protein